MLRKTTVATIGNFYLEIPKPETRRGNVIAPRAPIVAATLIFLILAAAPLSAQTDFSDAEVSVCCCPHFSRHNQGLVSIGERR